jgi:hypothetical protein
LEDIESEYAQRRASISDESDALSRMNDEIETFLVKNAQALTKSSLARKCPKKFLKNPLSGSILHPRVSL